MEFHFNLTNQQVDEMSKNYPVWFGDDFRGSLEGWIREWIVGKNRYDIKLSENKDYRFDVIIYLEEKSHCNPIATVECSKDVSNFRY